MPEAFAVHGTVSLAVSGTSASVAIPAGATTLELQNAGDVIVFVRWSPAATTAVATDYPVLPGQSKVITIGSGHTVLAGITAGGSATLYISHGKGL